ncbi:hypothetical protein BVC80_9067g52 [Macleaya cordata]|uniref:SNRNP25 ubiquitin-like domain-containing protein n=1 Tax=Macleaya cordata TaxID=56857 RepID=A0A200PNS4_MACCD|nr:hypothetical protein BVC80_9067g52 [Macleaya cordata]
MRSIIKQEVVLNPSFSYRKLPQQHVLNLSVLKLDGSSFDVQVAKAASVAELKLAVEKVFIQTPINGQCQISWSHVWGHFCLCFESQKLLNDKANIRSFGIKDGDQICFMRHHSLNYSPVKKRFKNTSATCEQQIKSLSGFEACEEKMEKSGGHKGDTQVESGEHHHFEDGGEDGDLGGHPEFKLSHFFRGLQKYSRRWNGGRMKTEHKLRPSKYSGHFLRVGSRLHDFRRS